MLCTFTIKTGNLVIRSDDIRQIEDIEYTSESGETGVWSLLRWMVGTEVFKIAIRGTAAENRDRIQQEELDLIGDGRGASL